MLQSVHEMSHSAVASSDSLPPLVDESDLEWEDELPKYVRREVPNPFECERRLGEYLVQAVNRGDMDAKVCCTIAYYAAHMGGKVVNKKTAWRPHSRRTPIRATRNESFELLLAWTWRANT